jgi:simple sugar transport system ATP-binding protein
MGQCAVHHSLDVHRRTDRILTLPVLELRNIRKAFGETVALSDASVTVTSGTIHALVGENGAGKTTLMRIAFGMLLPDSGTIAIDGTERRFHAPTDAIAAGIGMVHQHFTLVPVMTVAENIALGRRGRYRRGATLRQVSEVAERAGLSIDPSERVSNLSVGGQQRVEIIKALTRDAQILILDEPTAVLPPLEAASLLDWLKQYVRSGRSAILITHKVKEALRVADHVTVLRQGKVVFSAPRNNVTGEQLATMMVDEISAQLASRSPASESPAVVLEDVSVISGGRVRLAHANLSIRSGEILGIAGVEGSGHRELLRVIAGRVEPDAGVRRGPGDAAFIPEDRHREALALEMTATENVALRGASRLRGLMHWSKLRQQARELTAANDVRGAVPDSPVRHLSGGNQQKLVVARELADTPSIVVAESPTRGLDLRATASVHAKLIEARARGAAVVLYSTDIEELLSLADRVVVVHAQVASEVPPAADAIARALVGVTS